MMLLVPAVPLVTALVLAAGTVQPSYTAEPTQTTETSRAGSRAGEGRERPGRGGADTEPGEVGADEPTDPGRYTDTEAARPTGAPHDPRDSHDPGPEPSRDAAPSDPETPRETDQEAVAQPGAVESPVQRALLLGGGLILIGLGLGLAFVALRVRRS